MIWISYVEHVERPDPPKKIWCFLGWNFLGCRFVFYLFFLQSSPGIDMMDFFVRKNGLGLA